MCMSTHLLNFVKCVSKVRTCTDVKWEYLKGLADFKCGSNSYNKQSMLSVQSELENQSDRDPSIKFQYWYMRLIDNWLLID